jgi:hypothetical protein
MRHESAAVFQLAPFKHLGERAKRMVQGIEFVQVAMFANPSRIRAIVYPLQSEHCDRWQCASW